MESSSKLLTGTDPEARALVRAASERTYRFPPGFAGFEAAFEAYDEAQILSGELTVRSPQDVALSPVPADTDRWSWLTQEIASLTGHRWPSTFDDRDGRYDFTFAGPVQPAGQRVKLHGDPLSSSYRIRDGAVIEVDRTAGQQRFTIHVLSKVEFPDGRYASADYIVVYRNAATGDLQRTDAYTDEYTPVGELWLPSARRLIIHTAAEITHRGVTLHAHRML